MGKISGGVMRAVLTILIDVVVLSFAFRIC